MPSRVRMRGRETPIERILFVVVLGCSVLLLSVVMLRSESSSTTRTFRDGFIVAEQSSVVVQRRAETNNTTTIDSQGNGPQVQVEQQGDHTMTKIKTGNGDEITIKRASNSKKITKISAHQDGKITIENHEKATDLDTGMNAARGADNLIDTDTKDGNIVDVEDTKRASYEKIAPGRESNLQIEVQRRIDVETDGAKNKKVTIVELGDAHAKVSVEDAEAIAGR